MTGSTTFRAQFGVLAGVCLLALGAHSCSQPSSETEAAGPAIEVTVEQLAKAYEANEAAAQAEFGGKVLRVQSIVDSIQLGSEDQPFVNLKGGDTLLPIQLKFAAEHASSAATLTKGKSYSFECASVSEVLGTPMLGNCRLAS